MATLAGKITDVTSKTPESISSITVKAPSVRIGGGTDVIVSSPATVDFNRDTGDITIGGLTGGLSWLYIEGDGWSDSIALSVAEGMITLVEAIANAAGIPGLSDYVALLVGLQNRVDDIAQDAVDAAAVDIRWEKLPVIADINEALTPGAHQTNNNTINLPPANTKMGTVEVFPVGSMVTQKFTTYGATAEVWVRSRRSATEWYPWVDVTGKPQWYTHKPVADANTVTGVGVSYTDNNTLNLPEGSASNLGTLETFGVVSQYIQRFTTYGLTNEVWIRARKNETEWYPWSTETDSDKTTDAPVHDSTPAGLKIVPLALTVGGGNSLAPTSGSYRVPVHFGALITRWRVCVTNRNPRYEVNNGAAVTLNRVTIGAHAGNGHFAGGSTTIATNVSVPANGDVLRLPWQTTPLEAGSENLLGFQYTSTGQPNALVGGGWSTTGSAADLTPATTPVTQVPLDWWIEAETYATTPVIAAFGDSLSSGVGATTPVYDSWLSQYCREFGALPVHFTASGDRVGHWMLDLDFYKWDRWDDLPRPDALIVAIGSNDISGDDSMALIKQNIEAATSEWARKLTTNIYGANIMPRTNWDSVKEARRVEYNGWLASNQRFRQVFDFASVVDDGTGNIKPEYDTDQVHLNTAGYTALAGVITPVTAPPVQYAGTAS